MTRKGLSEGVTYMPRCETQGTSRGTIRGSAFQAGGGAGAETTKPGASWVCSKDRGELSRRRPVEAGGQTARVPRLDFILWKEAVALKPGPVF